MKEAVNHPDHYQGSIECIEAIAVATEGLHGIESFNTGNAIKYLWRWKQKNGIEDLLKAIWYIQNTIDRQEVEENEKANTTAQERRFTPT
ncbi:DUF3310 domain-containing protein [Paenibacillus pinihumi]|uniref:DUF3310 domain-containing protein n=1 Tax=Paenibacillus pinihumi TaxID=669462 RepID=UPI0012B5CBDD|nr:DUF3310 domain-containing protein [Paenibacillus pinihumi]